MIKPLIKGEHYDLDLVCAVDLSKTQVSQKHVKQLIGVEIKNYSIANSFKKPAEEKKRCWRLNYQDSVSFHMDILPSVPQDKVHILTLIEKQVEPVLAELSVGITDQTHQTYEQINSNWYSSNPRGFARWFEEILRVAARQQIQYLVENRAYATIEDVPPYEWKTPLQRVIQILKRHRDVMFCKNKELAPISMIITTLAARAYSNETEVFQALSNIIDKMPLFIKPSPPRVENPVNPEEDFADAWQKNPALEENFWAWHSQVKADVRNLRQCNQTDKASDYIKKAFGLFLTDKQNNELSSLSIVPDIDTTSP